MDSLPFDEHFQKFFIAHLLRDSDFLLNTIQDLDPDIFSNDTWKRIVRLCVEFGREFKAAPDTLAFRVLDSWKAKGLVAESLHKTVSASLDEFFAYPLQNREYLRKQYDTFLRQQKAKSLLVPFIDHLRKEEFEEAESLMKELFSFRPSSKIDLGGPLLADPTDRIIRRRTEEHTRLWTLIPELDKRIDGLRGGEIGIWQSQRSSAGKSAALQLLARSFAFQGKKSLIFTLEMGKAAYEDRLDQCIAGISRQGLTSKQRIFEKLSHMLKHGGGIWVCELPPHVTKISTLRKYADMIANVHNFHPDAVLIDYAGLLGPETPSLRGDLFATGQEVYGEWIAWMKEEKLVGWTGEQSGRGAMEQLVADQQHIGGSIAKVQMADLILSINRTGEEAERKLTRIFVEKNREGAAQYTVTINSDFNKMAFWTRSPE